MTNSDLTQSSLMYPGRIYAVVVILFSVFFGYCQICHILSFVIVEKCHISLICKEIPHIYAVFSFLPQSLGNSQREYEKHVLLYSIRNQLRFRNNLGESGYFTGSLLLLFNLLLT